MSKKESKIDREADGSATVDFYANAGRGLNVVFTPVKAPKLCSTEKNEMF